MNDILEALTGLSAAEDIFHFFSISYNPAVVHVSRLHILKRFNQYLRTAQPEIVDLASDAQFQAYRTLLIRAYEDFVRSTPAQEKVFKVFQDAQGGHIGVDSLRSTLPSRKAF
jgi:nitrogenase-stabilizing/protective protein